MKTEIRLNISIIVAESQACTVVLQLLSCVSILIECLVFISFCPGHVLLYVTAIITHCDFV